jgi:hypothetical protein
MNNFGPPIRDGMINCDTDDAMPGAFQASLDGAALEQRLTPRIRVLKKPALKEAGISSGTETSKTADRAFFTVYP